MRWLSWGRRVWKQRKQQNNFKARSRYKNASYSSTCSVVDLTALMDAEPHAKCSNHPREKEKKHPPEPRTAQRVCELEPKRCLSPWLTRTRQTNQTRCRTNRQTPAIISSVLLYISCKKRHAWNLLLCKLGFPVARRMSRTTTQAASLESSDWRLIASHLALKKAAPAGKVLHFPRLGATSYVPSECSRSHYGLNWQHWQCSD